MSLVVRVSPFIPTPVRNCHVQIVETIANAEVFDASGHAAFVLRAGVRYILHDSEAGFGLRDGALKLVTGLDRTLPVYNGQTLDRHHLILPFIGRRGDAVVVASCLAALRQKHPEVSIDIAAPDSPRDVLQLMPRFGELYAYPLEADRVGDYDYYLSFENIEAAPNGAGRSCADLFSRCLRTPRPHSPPSVVVTADARRRWRLEATDRPRVAIHGGRSGNQRSYPQDTAERLAHELVDAGFDVYWIGEDAPARRARLFSAQRIHDLVGRTPTPADLAAVLAQMHVLVTSDSFPMHLAGALGIPTIALFTATDAVLGSDYASVVTVQSQAVCSPCRVATGACPLGHAECIAHRDPSISPSAIVEHVHSLVQVADAF